MNSSPEREHRLSYEQIETVLRQFFDNYNVKVVVFAGGEPTLLGKDLLKAISFCKLNGVIAGSSPTPTGRTRRRPPSPSASSCARRASTSSMSAWTTTTSRTSLSSGSSTPTRPPCSSTSSASVIANCSGTASTLTPDYLEGQFGMSAVQGQRRFDVNGFSKYFERSEGGKLIVLSNGQVQRLGRGLDMIDDDECTFDCNMATVSPEAEAFGGCPWAVRSSAVSPRNHLLSCCGFELHGNPILDYGNLDAHPVTELIERADNDLITNMIALLGPPKVMQLLKQICPDEISFPRGIYHSYCETCQDLVGIEKNRRALYKYQGMFADLILKARDDLDRNFREPGGRVEPTPVRIPNIRIVSADQPSPLEVPTE